MKKIKKKKAFVINFSFSKLEYIFSKLIIYIINIKHRKCPLSQTMKNKYYYYLNLCLSRLILFWVIWAQIEVIKYCVFLGKFVFISEIKKTFYFTAQQLPTTFSVICLQLIRILVIVILIFVLVLISIIIISIFQTQV